MEYDYFIKATKTGFKTEWYNNNADERITLELFIHPEKDENNFYRILKINGDLDKIYPLYPPKDFTGTIDDWHDIVEKLSVKERHYFLKSTIGFQEWLTTMDTLLDFNYKIETVKVNEESE